MKRFLLLAVAALLASSPAFAQEKAAKPAAAKKMSAAGNRLGDIREFADGQREGCRMVVHRGQGPRTSAKGATKATAAAKDAKQPLAITQYVKVGDSVTVVYHEAGGVKHAADVIVRTAVPSPPKK